MDNDFVDGLKRRWEALDANHKRIIFLAAGMVVVLGTSWAVTALSTNPDRKSPMSAAQRAVGAKEDVRLTQPPIRESTVDTMVSKLTSIQQRLDQSEAEKKSMEAYQKETIAALQEQIKGLSENSQGNNQFQEQMNALRARIDVLTNLQGQGPRAGQNLPAPSLSAPLPPTLPGSGVKPSLPAGATLPSLSGSSRGGVRGTPNTGVVSNEGTPQVEAGAGAAEPRREEPGRTMRIVGADSGKPAAKDKLASSGTTNTPVPASTPAQAGRAGGKTSSYEPGKSVSPDAGAGAAPYRSGGSGGGSSGEGSLNVKGRDNQGWGGTTARDAKDKPSGKGEAQTYLPAGAMFTGVLLNGLDAPTSQAAQKNPTPVIIRIKTAAILPNHASLDIRECFVLASGFGSMSTERATLRTETITCVRKDGGVVEARMNGYLVDSDGKVGLRGTLVSKQGALVARSMISGIFSGLAQVFRPTAVPAVSTSPGNNQQYQLPDVTAALDSGVMGGLNSTLNQVSKFYLDLAKETHPVIEIDAGRVATIVLVHGVGLNI